MRALEPIFSSSRKPKFGKMVEEDEIENDIHLVRI